MYRKQLETSSFCNLKTKKKPLKRTNYYIHVIIFSIFEHRLAGTIRV